MTIWLQKVEIDGHTVQLAQEEEGGHVSGYSFSRDKYYQDPLELLPKDFKPVKMGKTKEQVEAELKEISEFPTLGLEERMLRQETLARFNIRTGLSEQDGETITTLHFPYTKAGEIISYKTKLINPKKFWSVGSAKDADLFGWEQAITSGSKKLMIVEGELDVPATYQMLKDKAAGGKWAHLDPAIVSVPNGAGAAKAAIIKHLVEIRRNFKEVVLLFDMDEPGQKAAKEVVRVVPDAMVADLPAKDANACLIEGYQKSFCNAVLFKASKPKNTRTVSIESLFEKARVPAVQGLSWPWSIITEKTRGIRFGETIYITGTAKIGKSDVLNSIVAHLVNKHDLKCFVCKPEEANVKSVKMIAGKLVGKIFHDPNVPFDEEAYEEATEIMRGKIELVNIYQDLDWDVLKGDITEAAVNGCKAIFIDPLTVLTTGLSAADANTKLQEIAQNLSTLAKDLDVVIFIFTHLKNPKNGEPYDRGGKINVGDITGSRGMTRSCNMILGIQGNNDPELEDEERNLRDIVLLSDREFGASGIQHLFWDKNTSLFNEVNR